ncbi:hypothetical protein HY256_10000 [Candidatus Sumerlaeota bacterium]|nr:hypothetical protein [Candidatus Sumerlaeota bacterium]
MNPILKSVASAIALAALGACATVLPDASPDHPANPNAPVAPPVLLTQDLNYDASATFRPVEAPAPPHAAHPMEGMPTSMPMAEISVIPYPLDRCIVTGNKLGTMGDPVIKVYEGREIRFCCPACPPKFDADKVNYLKKLDAAIAASNPGTKGEMKHEHQP